MQRDMATLTLFSTQLGERWRAIDPAWKWAVGVYTVARVVYFVWAVVVFLAVPSVTQNLDLFGAPLVATFEPGTNERYVFSRRVGDRVLTFRGEVGGNITDAETESVWSLEQGQAIRGPLEGKRLEAAGYTAEDVFPYKGVEPEPGLFGVWQRFDVLWYQAIAEKGYGATAGDLHFAPLYPLLERIAAVGLGGRYFLAGWLISQAALIGALGLLYRLTVRYWNEHTANRAVVFTVLFPTAFFFFTAYSESLCLLLSLLTFWELDRKAWAWAGFFAFLAILTRLQSVALLAPLGYWAWRMLRSEKKVSMGLVMMLGVPVAAGVFYLGLRMLGGEAHVVPTNEPQLNARLALPWDNLAYGIRTVVSGQFLIADVLNLAVTLLAAAILIRGWKELPTSMALYCAATIMIVMMRYVDTQPLNSMTRYLLTLFPLTMLLAVWSKNRWVERAVVYGFAPLNLYLCAQFLLWGWVA
jgi:hypothetical protein